MEREAIPAVGIVCKGFAYNANLIAESEGLHEIRLVEYPPPNIAVQSSEEIYKCAKALLDEVIKALTGPATGAKRLAATPVEAATREIIFRGTLEEVNQFFQEKRWTDGLPIIPPTVEAVDEMLRYTDLSPAKVLGTLPPGNGEATVWSVAVNGVMAGCRPPYMPVLLALVEAIAEPRFGLQHAGSTVGWTPMIIMNGPLIKELDFNCGQGVLRPERQANITAARFLRLYMVNIAGYLTGATDMATFGRNYYPVLAEAEDQSPWVPLSVERGFRPGSSVITVLSCMSMSEHFESIGTASDHLRILAREVARQLISAATPVAGFGHEVSPLVCLSPLVATVIASGGYSKDDVKEYLFKNARIPAHEFDEKVRRTWPDFTACKAVKSGKLPECFCETEDPNRMVPLVHSPEEFLIVVSGHEARNRSFVVAQCGEQGLAVSKEVRLPNDWPRLLR